MRHALIATIATAILSTAVATAQTPSQEPAHGVRLPVEGELPSLGMATTWLNSAPLTATGLRGKVVLVDFWTFTCINWLRSLPYVRAWAETYKDQGLVVIGVHTPEFSFEMDVANVRRAAQAMRVDYPIAVDSAYAIWRAFRNEYWPALYVIDAQGRIRHHQFGEGGYEQSEAVIRQLLAEAGAKLPDRAPVAVEARGFEAEADWQSLQSPENYLGFARTENFGSPGGVVENAPSTYRTLSALPLNWWTLAGTWTMSGEFVTLNDKSGSIDYRFHARDLHLVMGPATQGEKVRFRVTIDGAPPGEDHGADIDAEGWGSLGEARLYQLVRQARPVADRTFRIEFLGPGARAYAVTFG
jgi:thiol-disulfide isomerase/thioredoxin